MKVLCIPKPSDMTHGVYPFKGTFNEYSWQDRAYVDNDTNVEFASEYPQLIPYVAVKYDNKYLTYHRKGTETRLHGLKSFGFGGHIEESDIFEFTFLSDLFIPIERELMEELGLKPDDYKLQIYPKFIYSNKTNVSKVHIGVVAIAELHKDNLNPDGLEIINPQWESMSSIRANMDNYETWSYLLAKAIDK